ncbi:MAG: HIT domain-containing protein [Candidatus Bathyarchaeota archaeon]|nr:HIT domain-containing protein [Candidatus Bathyarchaeota archaeon]
MYEDELVKAFLDINPASEGHALIIPKKHHETIYEIPDKELKRIIIVAKKLAKLYKRVLAAKAINLLQASGSEAQQDVFHFHMHLVPRHERDGLNLWYRSKPKIKAEFDETLQKIKQHIKEKAQR